VTTSIIGALASSASAMQSQSAVGAGALASLSTSITATNIQGAYATVTGVFGQLSSSGTATQKISATVSPSLSLSTQINASSANAAAVSAALGVLQCGAVASQSRVSYASGQIGPLSTSIAVTFGSRILSVDPLYCIRLPRRSFCIKSPARSFYAAMLARNFYVRCNPMLNTIPNMGHKGPLETCVITLDATLELAPGETLTGTPSIVISTQIGSDNLASLVLSNAIINSQAVTLINGGTIAAGCAVQAVATEGQFSSQYLINATVPTSNPDKVLTLQATLTMRAQ
jgi:hypothetical protein